MDCAFDVIEKTPESGVVKVQCRYCGMTASVPENDVYNVFSVCSARTATATEKPGEQLKRLLGWLRLEAVPGCPCNDRAAQMDRWGCDECERRIDEIVGWLREAASQRGLPFIEVGARVMVTRAIALARKSALASS